VIKNWRVIIIAILIISSFTVAGCAAGDLPAPGGLTPGSSSSGYQQVLGNSLLVLKNSVTYKFNIDISMVMDIKGGSTAGKLNLGSTFNGTIKQNTGEARIDMNMSLKSNQEDISSDAQNVTLQMFLLTDTLYLGMDIPAAGRQWFKTAYSEDIARTYNLNEVEQQLAPLADNVTNLKLVKSEVFDGSDCYVLSMTPNMAEIIPWLSQDLPADVSADQISKVFKQLSYTAWIARDSGQLKNLQGTMQLQISAGQFESSENLGFNSLTMNITLAMKLYDYNVPVTITLPPEAKKAAELPGLKAG
jgi:hypothetical protein